VLKDQIFIR